MKASNILEIVLTVVQQIEAWAKEGLSDAEIRARLAAPGDVGQQLIEAARARASALDDYIQKG